MALSSIGSATTTIGYYDKLQFDPTSRYVLGMEVGFEHRSPTGDDIIKVGMVDLQDDDRWMELGASNAWCWQQGCMLQWLPGSKTKVIWNDRQKNRFVCHILDVTTRQRRTIPHAIYSARPDGDDIRVVIPNGYASHFIWRDPQHILSQSKNWLGASNWSNFPFEDREGGKVEQVGQGVLDGSGHLSYLPGNEWILNDTYPQGKKRLQKPHLYHIETNRRSDLGHFHLPAIYNGEWRVDTHPRFSPDLRYVCIDAPVKDSGRQLHLIDIRDILRRASYPRNEIKTGTAKSSVGK